MKICKKCNEPKGLFEFSAHRSAKDRLQSYCKPCAKAAFLAYAQKNPGHKRKSRYGIDQQTFDAMVEEQKNRCAVCETEMGKPHVDHDHKSLKVRGLLCNHCNLGLGHFFDNPLLLAKALQYLERHGN